MDGRTDWGQQSLPDCVTSGDRVTSLLEGVQYPCLVWQLLLFLFWAERLFFWLFFFFLLWTFKIQNCFRCKNVPCSVVLQLVFACILWYLLASLIVPSALKRLRMLWAVYKYKLSDWFVFCFCIFQKILALLIIKYKRNSTSPPKKLPNI